MTAAVLALPVQMPSAALAVLDLGVRLQFRDERIHRTAARLVAQEVLDLVVDVNERLLAAALLVRLVDGYGYGLLIDTGDSGCLG